MHLLQENAPVLTDLIEITEASHCGFELLLLPHY